jgi:hypothetical protein
MGFLFCVSFILFHTGNEPFPLLFVCPDNREFLSKQLVTVIVERPCTLEIYITDSQILKVETQNAFKGGLQNIPDPHGFFTQLDRVG